MIGHPVAHSLSPAIHNAALEADGRNARYLAYDVRPDDLVSAVLGAAAMGFAGLNVTIPHKRAALVAATSRSESVEQIGATNTLVFTAGEIVAHNTDVDGVLGSLGELGVTPAGLRCLVVGAGGAGRATAWALARAGAAEVAVSNRTAAGAGETCTLIEAAGGRSREVPWSDLGPAFEAAEIVVHTTSVGLGDDRSVTDDVTLGRAAAAGCRAVLDLVYRASETKLVRSARQVGIPASDGLGALVHQAAAAYALFWSAPAPIDVMKRAAAAATKRS